MLFFIKTISVDSQRRIMPHKSDILSWRGKKQVSHSRGAIDVINQDQGKAFHTGKYKRLNPKTKE